LIFDILALQSITLGRSPTLLVVDGRTDRDGHGFKPWEKAGAAGETP